MFGFVVCWLCCSTITFVTLTHVFSFQEKFPALSFSAVKGDQSHDAGVVKGWPAPRLSCLLGDSGESSDDGSVITHNNDSDEAGPSIKRKRSEEGEMRKFILFTI
jgi:hypothetical protein